ncbi:uncharacterized protein ACHE_60469S [Aspergillus chevalieri]|uniref:Rhodopsin domain-containing protein n=1 Tax=Aspergillus chevalieri TaxID=182096 RepID=A0A7R7VTM0_ASPCH|nr:uncharacterized protein ACHE_60469S [Aspergillus chevalieri]BCR90583.1 hypothetical protein ACHE_60469S [Aspergillus chevalieri]
MTICFGFFITISYPLTIWFTMANCCRPVSYFWNKFSGAKGTYINANQLFLALGIINILSDFIVLLIPFPRIVAPQMSIRKKMAICGIMAVGVFACIASIVRIYYLSLFMNAADVNWLMGPVLLVHDRAVHCNRLRLSTTTSASCAASLPIRFN